MVTAVPANGQVVQVPRCLRNLKAGFKALCLRWRMWATQWATLISGGDALLNTSFLEANGALGQGLPSPTDSGQQVVATLRVGSTRTSEMKFVVAFVWVNVTWMGWARLMLVVYSQLREGM